MKSKRKAKSKYAPLASVVGRTVTLHYEYSCPVCKHKIGDWTKAVAHADDHEENALDKETDYEEPDYPDVGVIGTNGRATFYSKKQASRLLELKQKRSSWYAAYSYVMQWEGPGEYVIVPSHHHDYHRGSDDIVYTATFKKVVSKPDDV